jgi:hypothetical protein
MKTVQHICERQKDSRGRLGAANKARFDFNEQPQTMTLSCSRWNVGRKVSIKVSVANAAN